MKALWRKTLRLFLRHPILCLPAFCAKLIALCLAWLNGLAGGKIVNSVLARHSLTTTNLKTSDLANLPLWELNLIQMPLGLGVSFLAICLYVLAFVVTAVLAQEILWPQRSGLLIGVLRKRRRPILLFSLKLFALGIVVGSLISLAELGVGRVWHGTLLHIAISYCFALAVGSSIAWLMTPPALGLVQSTRLPLVSLESVRLARIFAICTIAVSEALASLWLWARIFVVTPLHGLQRLIADDAASLLASIPYILLLIALSALAVAETSEDEQSCS